MLIGFVRSFFSFPRNQLQTKRQCRDIQGRLILHYSFEMFIQTPGKKIPNFLVILRALFRAEGRWDILQESLQV